MLFTTTVHQEKSIGNSYVTLVQQWVLGALLQGRRICSVVFLFLVFFKEMESLPFYGGNVRFRDVPQKYVGPISDGSDQYGNTSSSDEE